MTGVVQPHEFAEVLDASYTQDGFRIVLDTERGVETIYIGNGAFTQQNPTLQLLAFCSARPSTIDEEFVGTPLPLDVGGQVLQSAFEYGMSQLDEAGWGPDPMNS